MLGSLLVCGEKVDEGECKAGGRSRQSLVDFQGLEAFQMLADR